MYVAALLALLVAAVAAQSEQETIAELDANERALNKLTTRIENLSAKIEQRLANRREADRKSKNMLLRMDRMDIDDGAFRCPKSGDGRDTYFKCRTGQQCIGNILVCDNTADCLDGSDEDPDFCRVPFKVGDNYAGQALYYDCSASTESSNIIIGVSIMEIEERESIQSIMKLKFKYNWNFQTHEIRTFPAVGRYDFANRKIISKFVYENVYMYHEYQLENDDQTMYDRTVVSNTGQVCAEFVMQKGRYFDFQRMLETNDITGNFKDKLSYV